MNLQDYLDSPRPEMRRDSTGILRKIAWPKGRVIARCGEVFMLQTSRNRYSVVYGLQVHNRMSYGEASSDFGHCCIHQAECESLAIP